MRTTGCWGEDGTGAGAGATVRAGARTMPQKPWEESREQFGERMRTIARHINAEREVEGLCREFPDRIQRLVDAEEDSLSK